jgi:hypothetical protein
MSFPVQVSHYASQEFRYLVSRLNVQKMFDFYKERYPDSKVSYKFYIKYFKDNFSLSFEQPQIDTCITCEKLMVKIRSPILPENAKRVASAEFMVHKRCGSKFYKAMEDCTEACQKDKLVLGLCFDYMQNLPLPKIPIQDVFYLRQLWVNVFCVHNMKTRKSVMYVYHEGVGTARKGANEVCSCLYDNMKQNVPACVCDRNCIYFQMGMWGKIKNHTMICLCMAEVDTSMFDNVQQFFPVHRQSYNTCDRNFGLVKRVLRRVDHVYSVKEYVGFIVNAAKRNCFSVKLISTEDVSNFTARWPKYYQRGGLSLETQGRHTPKSGKITFQPMSFMHFKSSPRIKVNYCLKKLKSTTIPLYSF